MKFKKVLNQLKSSIPVLIGNVRSKWFPNNLRQSDWLFTHNFLKISNRGPRLSRMVFLRTGLKLGVLLIKIFGNQKSDDSTYREWCSPQVCPDNQVEVCQCQGKLLKYRFELPNYILIPIKKVFLAKT